MRWLSLCHTTNEPPGFVGGRGESEAEGWQTESTARGLTWPLGGAGQRLPAPHLALGLLTLPAARAGGHLLPTLPLAEGTLCPTPPLGALHTTPLHIASPQQYAIQAPNLKPFPAALTSQTCKRGIFALSRLPTDRLKTTYSRMPPRRTPRYKPVYVT